MKRIQNQRRKARRVKKRTKKKVKFDEEKTEEKTEETKDNSEEIREFVSDVIKKVKTELTVNKEGDDVEEVKEENKNVKEIVMKSNRGRKKPEVEIVKVEEKVEKKKNKWFEHLANVRSENPGLTYKEQRKIAQESYKKTG